MSHRLKRFAYSEVFNTPQLIEQTSFQPITSYLKHRLFDANFSILDDAEDKPEDYRRYERMGSVAVVPIAGTLTYKPQFMLCQESTSYVELIRDVEELAASGVKTIVFEANSGGGAASHMMESADVIRDILTKNNIKSVTYVDTMCASAALGLGVVSDEIIINPSASIGSIGALICLMDSSEAMKKEGLKEIYISSAEKKVPLDAEGKFKPDFIEKLQQDVIALGEEFAAHVSKYTGISTEEILSWQADIFRPQEALTKGLVNSIMTHQEFSDHVAKYYSS